MPSSVSSDVVQDAGLDVGADGDDGAVEFRYAKLAEGPVVGGVGGDDL